MRRKKTKLFLSVMVVVCASGSLLFHYARRADRREMGYLWKLTPEFSIAEDLAKLHAKVAVLLEEQESADYYTHTQLDDVPEEMYDEIPYIRIIDGYEKKWAVPVERSATIHKMLYDRYKMLYKRERLFQNASNYLKWGSIMLGVVLLALWFIDLK